MHGETRQSGFTLLELLIAITLLAIIMVFMTSALNFSHRAWKLSEDMNRAAPASVVRNFLRDQISSAYLARVRGDNNNIQVVFSGQNDRIEFVSIMPDRVVEGGLYRLAVFREGASLRVSISPYHPTIRALNAGENKLLLTGLENFNISYYGPPQNGQPSIWRTSWPRKDIPPLMVKFEAGFKDRRKWPPLIIELKVR